MTHISSDDVQHLAQLSSLQLTSDEIVDLQGDLSNILSYIEKLNDLDTSNVSPTYQVTGLENIWRDDVIREDGIGREELLELAPEIHDNQVKVPKVL